jgi:hypothetical protein
VLLKSDLGVQQTITPKARAKHGTFVEPNAFSLSYKSSCLAPALGVTKCSNVKGAILVTLFVLLKPDLYVKETYL